MNFDALGRTNPQRKFNPTKAQLEASAHARQIGVKALNARASKLAVKSEKQVLSYMRNHDQVKSKQIADFYGFNNDWLRKHVIPRLIKKGLVTRVIVLSESGWPMRYEYRVSHE